MLMRSLLTLFIAIIAVVPTQSQLPTNEGREFWVAFQKNFRNFVTDPQTSGRKPAEPLHLELTIISQSEAHGVVEVAGIGFKQEFTVKPGAATVVALDP